MKLMYSQDENILYIEREKERERIIKKQWYQDKLKITW